MLEKLNHNILIKTKIQLEIDRRHSGEKIITLDTDSSNKIDALSTNKSFSTKKRDSNVKLVPFFVENKDLLKNNTKSDSKALVAARGGRDLKRISINLEQVDMTTVDANGSDKLLADKRNSVASKGLDLIESSTYYGIRNEKLVKIVHK